MQIVFMKTNDVYTSFRYKKEKEIFIVEFFFLHIQLIFFYLKIKTLRKQFFGRKIV